MAKIIKPSFAGGEVSVAVGARVDLAKRAIAVEKAENFLATTSGAMDSRVGLSFVGRAKDNAEKYLFPFQLSSVITLILEVGDQYIRFYRDGAQVLDSSTADVIEGATQANPVVLTMTGHSFSNGDEIYVSDVAGMTELNGRNFLVSNAAANTIELHDLNGVDVDGTGYTAYTSGGACTTIYEISTPYVSADVGDLRYAQSGNIITLVHPDYEERELIRTADDDWSLGIISLEPNQAPLDTSRISINTLQQNLSISNITQASPGVVTYSGTIYPDGDTKETARELQDGDIVEVDNVKGMVELNNTLFRVKKVTNTTIRLGDIDDGVNTDTSALTAYISGGILRYCAQPRWYKVTAVNGVTGEESLPAKRLSDHDITSATQANPVVITTSEGHGYRAGDEVEIYGVNGMTELNDQRFLITPLSLTTFSLQWPEGGDVDGTGYGAYTSAGEVALIGVLAGTSLPAEWENRVYWEAPVAGASLYNVYASTGGGYGYIGSTSRQSFVDANIAPDFSKAPPRTRDPFRDTEGTGNTYPATVAFSDQRRVFGRTNDHPDRLFLGAIGDIYDFSGSEPLQDDDPIIASLVAPRINEIQHLVPLSDLIVFTSGGEYRVLGGDAGLTPSTIQIKPQSYYGSTKLPPILAGEVGLFATPGWHIRDFSYQFVDDKFVGKDVTVLARHLFRNHSLVDWAFAASPHSVAWAIRDDGLLLSLTYLPEQDVYAWTRHTTYGKFKSVAVIREGGYDVPYFLIERKINGTTVQTIERMQARTFTDLHDAFCVDAGLTLDSPITITGATAANPVVITTSAAHGLSNGDTVDLSGIKEAVAVVVSTDREQVSSGYNGVGFTVANVTATTFELQSSGVDVDGSGFAAYSSGGEVREAVTTVGGLWHLEGASVVAAANGEAVDGLTVSNGQITLPSPASRVHVGLPYIPRLVTLPLSSYADGKTINGRAKNVSRLTVDLEFSRGLWTGPTTDQMREYKASALATREAADFYADSVDVTLKSDWAKKKQLVVEQRDPLPLTITALTPDANVGGN